MEKDDRDVILIIKYPYRVMPDVEICCLKSWTIGMLKKHLSQVYPGNPEVEQQKIIYMGQLIKDDHLTIEKMLNEKDLLQISHIVHLVFPCKLLSQDENRSITSDVTTTQSNTLTTSGNIAFENSSPEASYNQHQYMAAWQQYLHAVYMWQMSLVQSHANTAAPTSEATVNASGAVQPSTASEGTSFLGRIKRFFVSAGVDALFYPGSEFFIGILFIFLFNVLGTALLNAM